jgi:LacI family transcriptional regulator
MLVQPDAQATLSAASVRPHLVIRDSCQPPE